MSFRVGDYVLCKKTLIKKSSNNGDLICGRILQINGDQFVLLNLLTNAKSYKKRSVLESRNQAASKEDAMSVVEVFRKYDKYTARAHAAALCLGSLATPEDRTLPLFGEAS